MEEKEFLKNVKKLYKKARVQDLFQVKAVISSDGIPVPFLVVSDSVGLILPSDLTKLTFELGEYDLVFSLKAE